MNYLSFKVMKVKVWVQDIVQQYRKKWLDSQIGILIKFGYSPKVFKVMLCILMD